MIDDRQAAACRSTLRVSSQPHYLRHLQCLRQAAVPGLHGLLRRQHQAASAPNAALGSVSLKRHRLLAARGRSEAQARLSALSTTTSCAGRFFFLIFFVAMGIGWLVGEAVLRASGHYHGKTTAIIATVSCGPSSSAALLGLPEYGLQLELDGLRLHAADGHPQLAGHGFGRLLRLAAYQVTGC